MHWHAVPFMSPSNPSHPSLTPSEMGKWVQPGEAPSQASRCSETAATATQVAVSQGPCSLHCTRPSSLVGAQQLWLRTRSWELGWGLSTSLHHHELCDRGHAPLVCPCRSFPRNSNNGGDTSDRTEPWKGGWHAPALSTCAHRYCPQPRAQGRCCRAASCICCVGCARST